MLAIIAARFSLPPAGGAAAPRPERALRRALVVPALPVAKAVAPHQIWGIPFQAESVNPTDAALDSYASLHRGNDLVLVEPDDQFYSADLRLTQVRYLYIDPALDLLGAQAKNAAAVS